jgi:DNA gyrase subunit A
VVINEGDNLLSVHLTDDRRHVFMGTHQGMGIRFAESDVRSMGRVSAGVRGINLRAGDFVEEVATVDPEAENDILVVTDLGYGKRTRVNEFRLQRRGGFGVTLIRLSKKNGVVAGIRHVHESDEILLVTEGGMLIRMTVAEVRRIGRATQGVRLIRLDEGDRLVSVARAEGASADQEDDVDSEDAIDDTEQDIGAEAGEEEST